MSHHIPSRHKGTFSIDFDISHFGSERAFVQNITLSSKSERLSRLSPLARLDFVAPGHAISS
jgi:hypothetical protein